MKGNRNSDVRNSTTPSRNDKLKHCFRKVRRIQGFKETLRFVYDPYIRTGIADMKLIKGMHDMKNERLTVYDVIKYLVANQLARQRCALCVVYL